MSINGLTHKHFVTQLLQLNREKECLKTELWKYKSICYYYEKLRNYGNNTEESEDKCELNERILTLKSLKSPVIQLTRLENDDNITIVQNSNETECKVCGDKRIAPGNRYGVECCDACNHFFYDSLKSDHVGYYCVNDGKCLITRETRTQCRYCRYNKCIAVGMCRQSIGSVKVTDSVSNNEISLLNNCKVCEDKACEDYNSIICCNDCKSFFEDAVLKQKQYIGYCCVRDGNCVITSDTRNACRGCRYKKCIAVGMCVDYAEQRLGINKQQSTRITHPIMTFSEMTNIYKNGVNNSIDENSSVDSDAEYLLDKFEFESLTKKYVCEHFGCGKEYMSQTSLSHHRKVHKNKSKTCTEDGCGITLKSNNAYKNHLIRSHPELCTEINWLECTEDGCAFKTKLLFDFNDHQKDHQILKAKAMLNGLPADNHTPLPEYIELGDENGLMTSKVNISSRNQTNKWKRRLVGCAQPFKCDQPNCSAVFRSELGLRQHLTKFHRKFRLRVCGINGCRFSAISLQRLREHKYLKHSSIRRYVCDHDGCGKAFKASTNLRRHKAIHSTEKLYVCAWPGCEKRFKTNAGLFSHTKYHSDVPAYQCDWPECGYGTANKWNLDKHKAKHTGVQKYACVWPSCEFKTANQSNLNTHIKMHNRAARIFVKVMTRKSSNKYSQ